MVSVPVVVVLCSVVTIFSAIVTMLASVNMFFGYSATIEFFPVGKKFYVRELSATFGGAFLELCNSSGKTNIVRHIKDLPVGISAGQYVIVAKTERGEKMLIPLK